MGALDWLSWPFTAGASLALCAIGWVIGGRDAAAVFACVGFLHGFWLDNSDGRYATALQKPTAILIVITLAAAVWTFLATPVQV